MPAYSTTVPTATDDRAAVFRETVDAIRKTVRERDAQIERIRSERRELAADLTAAQAEASRLKADLQRVQERLQRFERAWQHVENAEVELFEVRDGAGLGVIGDADAQDADSWPNQLDRTDRACLASVAFHLAESLKLREGRL